MGRMFFSVRNWCRIAEMAYESIRLFEQEVKVFPPALFEQEVKVFAAGLRFAAILNDARRRWRPHPSATDTGWPDIFLLPVQTSMLHAWTPLNPEKRHFGAQGINGGGSRRWRFR